MKFKIEPGEDGQFYVKIKAANGENWFTSEGYTREADAGRSVTDFQEELAERTIITQAGVETRQTESLRFVFDIPVERG